MKIHEFTEGVPVEIAAREQIANIASMEFVDKIAIMPDVHLGRGATIGSVIGCSKAIIPAAVGVDLGCGMMAVKTNYTASDLPDSLYRLRSDIEKSIPHGRSDGGGKADVGSWGGNVSIDALSTWDGLYSGFDEICKKHPKIKNSNGLNHLGTLGTGNHFVEICLDKKNNVWVMLHSGSRGVGNRIGSYFIAKAKEEMKRWFINIPDKDLSYIPHGSKYFDDYLFSINWAQRFAKSNRVLMMNEALRCLQSIVGKELIREDEAINCHHNYVSFEKHFGKDMWVTRKGALSAKKDELGIIPGSMGAKSFIVRGRGNKRSMNSCSHGAGRILSRTAAKNSFNENDLINQTKGVECRKDMGVIDEIPSAYKNIDDVMNAQKDLVEIVAELKQILCVKG